MIRGGEGGWGEGLGARGNQKERVRVKNGARITG